MKILCLDLSTSTGWALLDWKSLSDKETLELLSHGVVENDKPIVAFGPYPWNYLAAAESIVTKLTELIRRETPDVILVEEINLGKSRYSQRALEWIHALLVQWVRQNIPATSYVRRSEGFVRDDMPSLYYVSSSEWRKAINLRLDAEQRRNNARLSKAKKWAQEMKQPISVAKKKFGVAGKVTKKHLAVAYVNGRFGTSLLMKDNDRADAICLGCGFAAGAVLADGIL